MARTQVLLAALCFGTTGTAQALGPSAAPSSVGAARILVGAALLVGVAAWLGRGRSRRRPAAGPVALGGIALVLAGLVALGAGGEQRTARTAPARTALEPAAAVA